MRISDWSSDVCSSDLIVVHPSVEAQTLEELIALTSGGAPLNYASGGVGTVAHVAGELYNEKTGSSLTHVPYKGAGDAMNDLLAGRVHIYMNNIPSFIAHVGTRSEEHTSELQSLMRNSFAVFCLKKKKN